MNVCKHVLYSGRVQGVGFRYTAQGLAARFPVAGFVRNQPSGDVELVAEGPIDQVDAFLAELADRMADYIDHTSVLETEPTGRRGFSIRH
jgi:acylphosphatase